MKLNKKGFAITTIVYSVLILLSLSMFIVLGISRNMYQNEKDYMNDINDNLNYFLINKEFEDDFELIQEFNYNGTNGSDGSVQTFTVPKTGYYQLEAWGAQGGNYNGTYYGGYGGYSTGKVYLIAETELYIYVGGAGSQSTSSTSGIVAGGYNGGGYAYVISSSCSNSGGSGGGASHIATTSGVLSTLSSNVSSIVIVGGGGGGSSYRYCNANDYAYYSGGNGGGISGSSALVKVNYWSNTLPTGGTQTAVGTGGTTNGESGGANGAFGLGGQTSRTGGYTLGTGGGGGYYGGGNGMFIGGGGGSGYIGNSLLLSSSTLTKHMYTYCNENCTNYQSTNADTYTNTGTNVSATATSDYAKSGNGYAKITYIGQTAN